MLFLKFLFQDHKFDPIYAIIKIFEDEVGEKFEEKHHVYQTMAMGMIKTIIKKNIRQRKKRLKEEMKKDDFIPETFVYLLIFKITSEQVTTGNYHLYRGLLSSQGNAIYDIMILALKHLVVLNYLTDENYNATVKDIKDEIQCVG